MSFENAAVTKGFMVGCGLTSILVGLFDVKHYFHLQLVPHLSRHHQYWRLAAHHFAFSNSSDLFIAELVLYNVGVQIERQFGSVKFASFAIVSTLLTTIMEFLALMIFHRIGLNHIAMGPAPFLFSLLYQYSRVVPAIYHYRIFNVPLTNKSMVYLLALQMVISRPPGSIAVAVIGVLAGQVYRSDLTNLKAYRISPATVRFFSRFVLPLLGSFRPPRRTNRALPDETRGSSSRRASPQNEEIITTARTPGPSTRSRSPETSPIGIGTGSVVREWVNELTGRGEGGSARIHVPSEQEVLELTTMFPNVERAVIVAALQRSPDIQAAVETLLSGNVNR